MAIGTSARATKGTARAKNKAPAAKKRQTPKNGVSMASTADKYSLYQDSVQDPSFEVRMLKRAFKDARGRAPLTLREDFCGAAAVSCAWAASNRECEAWGVDYDPEPLAWGRERNLSPLKPSQQERVHLIEGDVRTAKTPKVDVVAAQNFSYYIFKSRDEMKRYFKNARRHLNDDGVFVLDMLGGPQVQEDDDEEKRRVGAFTYVWHQARFNPITHDAMFYIHFDFKDGSRLDKAFTYDWRLWTMPEVREILHEAGFSKTEVYWEASDEDGDGNGRFYRTENAPADLTWLAYIAAMP
jgi:SAM-dependent methyltransferase